MLKKIILLLVVMMIAITSSAQIQRTILGCTIGVSTEAQVKKAMKAKGVKLKWDDDHLLGEEVVKFAGVQFDAIGFYFKKHKLSQVTLMCYDTYKFFELSTSLKNKYGKYETLDSKEDFLKFEDKKTRVCLMDHLDKGYFGVSYLDIVLVLASGAKGSE